MGNRLATSILLTMLAHLCRGQDIMILKQTPAFQVILAKEYITICCSIIVPQEFTHTEVGLYRAGYDIFSNTPNITHSSPGKGNTTEIRYHFDFQPNHRHKTEPHVYYCSIADEKRRVIGTGTFIHVRDTGYIEYTAIIWRRVKTFLITSCSILAVLSLSGTILLLLWKKKGYPIRPPVQSLPEKGQQKRAVTSSSNRSEPSASGSIYSTLQHHSIDVYDTIEQDMKNQSQDSKPSSPVPSIPKQKPEIKKKPEMQSMGKKKSADMVPSIPKQKLEIKKKPERQSVQKKKAADMKIQPAEAQEENCDTLYENL